ncbi:MAG: sugar phosphate isomerase/epimerase, partial [Candidatus Ratteibacteria bacterium]|nr:sugar phosphate isomerase/epimerase [Candidatus Ratteibacteria bacterium]
TFFTDINFPTAKERQQGIDKIKEGIETAMILGTDKIMLPIGGKHGLTAEQSRRNVVEGLKQAVEIGNKCGVTITVEHFPDKLAPFITSEDVNEAIREVPDLRITYDGGNILTGGEDPVEGYLNSKTYIIHSHFKDWLISNDKKGLEGKDGNFYIPALVGDGIVDYKRVLEAMNSSCYSGYINIEYEGYDYRPEDAMAKGLQYLKTLMEG